MHHIKNAAIFTKEFNYDGRYLILNSLPNNSFIIMKKRTESWVRVPTILSCIWFQRNANGPIPYAGADKHRPLVRVWSPVMLCRLNVQPWCKFTCVLRIEINLSSCCTEYRSSFAEIMCSPYPVLWTFSFLIQKSGKGMTWWIVNSIY